MERPESVGTTERQWKTCRPKRIRWRSAKDSLDGPGEAMRYLGAYGDVEVAGVAAAAAVRNDDSEAFSEVHSSESSPDFLKVVGEFE